MNNMDILILRIWKTVIKLTEKSKVDGSETPISQKKIYSSLFHHIGSNTREKIK